MIGWRYVQWMGMGAATQEMSAEMMGDVFAVSTVLGLALVAMKKNMPAVRQAKVTEYCYLYGLFIIQGAQSLYQQNIAEEGAGVKNVSLALLMAAGSILWAYRKQQQETAVNPVRVPAANRLCRPRTS